MVRRMLSIWLPMLAIERWQRAFGQTTPSQTTAKPTATPAPDRQGRHNRREDTHGASTQANFSPGNFTRKDFTRGEIAQTPPAVLTESGAKGLIISAATPAARRLGIGPGMRLADARAIFPGLETAVHDRTGDQALLRQMADGMLRFTPWVAENGVDGLMLDVTGCAHLQGGEADLMQAIRALFQRAGFSVRLGLADTLGAAWAAARYGGEPDRLIAPGQTPQALAPMPLAALRLTPETLAKLRALGLKSVGQVMGLDRASLHRRFPATGSGPGLLSRLDQVLGRVDEPLSPRQEAPEYRVRQSPLEPLIDRAGIEAVFHELLQSLTGMLAGDGRGARHLTLSAFRADGPVIALPVGLARASRDARHITRLFAERLDGIDPGFGIDTLMLSVETTEPIAARQQALEGGGAQAAADALDQLVDRIANRIGPDNLTGLAPKASHLPERAASRQAPTTTVSATDGQSTTLLRTRTTTGDSTDTAPYSPTGPRPLTLFARPEPVEVMAEIPEGPPLSFRWRRVRHRVLRATGPERLAPEWWRDLAETTRTRDYYLIEDDKGGRYWLYRDGLYQEAAERGQPIWFLHGIFG